MANTFIVTGNLGRNAELRYTQNNKPVLNFSIANTTGYGDNEKTAWYKAAIFGDKAIKLEQHMTKGTKVLLIGELTFNEWEKDGIKKSAPEIFVKSFEFMSKKEAQTENSHTTNHKEDDVDMGIPF